MKKKIVTIIATFGLLTFVISSGTFAAIQADGNNVTTQISTSTLDISLDGDTSQIKFENIVPGETISKKIGISNIKEASIYTRVTIRKYWLNEENRKDENLDASIIKPLFNDTDWLVEFNDPQNGEDLVLYYRKPLANTEKTENFLKGIVVPTTLGNSFQNKKFALDIQVDAVQSLNGKDAMLSQWGVLATLDENGIINKIER